MPDAIRAVQLRYQRTQEIAYRQRILILLDGLSMLGQGARRRAGRKQVIFLSSGFDDTVLAGEQGQAGAERRGGAGPRPHVEVPSESRVRRPAGAGRR